MLESYIPGIDSWIGPKRYYNVYYENLVNKLHECIKKHPHEIQYQNVLDSTFVNINSTLIKKEKHLLQI